MRFAAPAEALALRGLQQSFVEALKVNKVTASLLHGIFLHGLRTFQTIETLDLANNNIGPNATRHVKIAFKVNQVTALPSSVIFLHALRFHQTVTSLHFEDENMGADEAQYLAEVLRANQVTGLP